MSKKSALNNPTHEAKLSYYDHDMSMIRKFTSSVGQLLPVYYDFLYPGDKVDYSTEMFSRLDIMETPAMVNITQHVDWFFVPMNQLYQFFGDWNFSIQDYKTDFAPAGVLNSLPTIPFNAVYNQFFKAATVKYSDLTASEKDEYGVPKYFNAIRLGELLGYTSGFAATNKTQRFNPFMFAAYQKIFNDVYRLSDRTANDVTSYNFDYHSYQYHC